MRLGPRPVDPGESARGIFFPGGPDVENFTRPQDGGSIPDDDANLGSAYDIHESTGSPVRSQFRAAGQRGASAVVEKKTDCLREDPGALASSIQGKIKEAREDL